MRTHKELAAAFFQMVTSGHVREAYDTYVSLDFIHHNAHFPGDRESLLRGMEENESKFPNKVFEIKRQLEDGDLVATHSKLRMNEEIPEMVVIHIVRFVDDKIVEMWDIGQEIPKDSPNKNGVI